MALGFLNLCICDYFSCLISLPHNIMSALCLILCVV
jgi:hypothetical protein